MIDAHRALTERVHAHGARIQPQLVHPGPDSLSPLLSGIPSLGPSVIPHYLTGTPCRELAAEEIPAIVEQFRAAARRVREAGYDGIELHAAHGYMLLGSFLTPWRNRRTRCVYRAHARGAAAPRPRGDPRDQARARRRLPAHAAHLGLRARAGRPLARGHPAHGARAGGGRRRRLPRERRRDRPAHDARW